MYSTFLRGKTSHEDVKDSTNWLFKAYYGNRMFMGYCCVAFEVLYLILFLIAEKQCESLVDGSPLSFLVALSLFGWAIKQMINVIQMKNLFVVLLLECLLFSVQAYMLRPADEITKLLQLI